jgi:pyruvate dehydrogenase E2 component (dihydrolipoamide acetyltransferase)
MATKVILPYTGEKESRGSIGMWFKKEGEPVQQGDPLCTIETAKASVEIEAPCSGILLKILAPGDSEVSMGDCIAIIGEAGENINSLI